MAKITVKHQTVKTIHKDGIDYTWIAEIAKQKNRDDPNGVIANWTRNINTSEILGIWEILYSPKFNPIEFEGFRIYAGLNASAM